MDWTVDRTVGVRVLPKTGVIVLHCWTVMVPFLPRSINSSDEFQGIPAKCWEVY